MITLLLAILNGWGFLLGTLFLINKHESFDINKDQLSRLDSLVNTQLYYRVSFAVFCLGQILVVSLLLDGYKNSWFYLLPLYGAAFLGLLLIIFTTKRNPIIHRLLGAFIFPLVCLGGLIFGFFLISHNIIVAVTGIIISTTMMASLLPSLKKKTLVAKYSLLYFFCLALWNTVNLAPLLYNMQSV